MPTFASTDSPKTAIPIKNKRYQIPRWPFTEKNAAGQEVPVRHDFTEPVAGVGMLVPWTRTSTILDTHKDKEGIFKWTKRLVVKGIGAREDLYALAAATRLADKFQLSDIADQAFDYAKGQAASNTGTALHNFLERHLEGDKDLVIPEPWRSDVAAVMVAFQDAKIRLRPEFQEVVVVRPDRKDGDAGGMAGRLDLLVEEYNEATGEWELVVADYKTGSNPLEYGAWEIQQQGGFYGSGWAIWDGEFWRPMPAGIARDHMLMIHVLPGQASVQIHRIEISQEDLEGDLDAAYRTRARRKAAKQAHRPLVTVEEGKVLDGTGTPNPEPVATEPTGPVAGPLRPPTADQQAQADLAAKRLAKVDEMARAAGRNDETDDDEPAAAGQAIAAAILNGQGKPLAELAGPGKKGCSVCHRVGHRKGSPACLGLEDPALETGAGFTLEESRANFAPKGHTHGVNGWTRNPISGTWECGEDGCTEPAAEPIQAELTAEQGKDFPGQLTPAEVESVREASRPAEEAEQAANGEADPFDDDEDETLTAAEQDWHLFLDRINEAPDKAAIRAIRVEATELGVWDDQLLQAGLARIKTFKA